MLHKIVFLYFALSLVTITTAFPQATTGRNLDDHLLIKDSKRALGSNISEDIEGTPYLDDNFTEGEVHFVKGNPTIVPMRYNIYDDWIEYQQNNQTFILDPHERIKKVALASQIFFVDKYESRGKMKTGYFTMLDSGKIMLVAKHIVTYKERKEAKALEAPTPARYTRAPDQFFYKIGDGELKKVENHKAMIEHFPDHKEALSQFAKKEKISHKKAEDLKKLIQFYNSL